jgi:hypothetical protein
LNNDIPGINCNCLPDRFDDDSFHYGSFILAFEKEKEKAALTDNKEID